MKKSDTEQDTSVLEEKIVPERQTDEELDKELQQIEEFGGKSHEKITKEIYIR